jgi:hypothetical protein
MKRYILCTILLGNLASGMTDPDFIEKTQLLADLEKEARSVIPGTRAEFEITGEIAQLRKELGKTGSDGETLDAIIEQMPTVADHAVTKKLECLGQLVVQINQAVDGQEKRALAQQIIGLRKELGKTELYQDLPPGSYTNELDVIIEQMPVENKPAAAKPSGALFCSHPADFIFDDIYHASKEELDAHYPNRNPDSDIGRAVLARMSKFKILP